MTETILLAIVIGFAFGALQLLLLRRVLLARSGITRALLLLLKLPLWAMALYGMAVWWGVGALIAFTAAASLLYFAILVVYYRRGQKRGERDA